MTRVTPFHPSHLGALKPDPAVAARMLEYSPEYFAALAAEPSITIWCANVPVVCGGVVGECEVWAVFDQERAPRHSVAISRAVGEFLRRFPYLYANVLRADWCEFPRRILGFTPAGTDSRNGRVHIHLERVA